MADIAKIRLKIGDTTVAYQFSDPELQSFLDDEGSVRLASAAALEAWAAVYATNPSSETIGGYAYSQKIADNMLSLAKRLRTSEAETPAMTWAEPDLLGE
ncbi:unnamed protein product [marine sediment metagenome]|uniref:Uncharacterized protein n=1 Tax=marine sediment metagenome TaxID=412755 RepID=X1J1K0_9ZZZZ